LQQEQTDHCLSAANIQLDDSVLLVAIREPLFQDLSLNVAGKGKFFVPAQRKKNISRVYDGGFVIIK